MNKSFVIALLFVLFTSTFAFPSAASPKLIPRQFDQFELCDDESYPVTFKTLYIIPNPIVPGENVTVNITGTTQEQIEKGAKLQIQPLAFGFPISTYNADFCTEAQVNVCPVPPGNFTYSFIIPTTITQDFENSKEYQTKITLMNSDDEKLICLEGSIKMADAASTQQTQ
ncbi:2641_t:CDS:2 [Funneliformis mosseae]|uniref:Phosphatidylglycerol/phosphatidylinositol transfer protein n=1 Tax=Funneliformis mosseae TaxID=27381 RepID=A0A9N8V913_FUNMO|nr:2641_t:CDS:2 [Funneliformis mosseae]